MSVEAVGIGNLGDIPDLSGVMDDTRPEFEAFQDGWYQGTILGKREFTDKNGNDRVFESGDDVAASGQSRNIRLQVELVRQSDKRTLNVSTLINYKPESLSAEVVREVLAQKERVKAGEQWGELFSAFMSLNRLASLQRIAGVRQFQRTDSGGLDLSPLFGKTAYFKIGPDSRNDQYKEVKQISETAPKGKKAAIL